MSKTLKELRDELEVHPMYSLVTPLAKNAKIQAIQEMLDRFNSAFDSTQAEKKTQAIESGQEIQGKIKAMRKIVTAEFQPEWEKAYTTYIKPIEDRRELEIKTRTSNLVEEFKTLQAVNPDLKSTAKGIKNASVDPSKAGRWFLAPNTFIAIVRACTKGNKAESLKAFNLLAIEKEWSNNGDRNRKLFFEGKNNSFDIGFIHPAYFEEIGAESVKAVEEFNKD